MRRFLWIVAGLTFACVAAYAAEYWWCKECGLAYPASQKFCLNKDCPLYRKSR